jgi:hypothetical protein
LAIVVALVGGIFGATSVAAARLNGWKGAETFTQTTLTPNPPRCGPPPNVEATFAGSGVDTVGGSFLVTVSGCLNTATLEAFDLAATDTYIHTDGSVDIAPDDFALVLDPETCVATNTTPVRFTVVGGTGAYKGARGVGHFDFAVNWTPCNGLAQPTHVWFRGRSIRE